MWLKFQSTPPARGATTSGTISIINSGLFQSTPPARGATQNRGYNLAKTGISIHAPREGGDRNACSMLYAAA